MQLSENIKMTNFHLTFLWIFPYNMGNNDRKGADPGMRKVDHNKQQKRESLLDSAFSLFIDNGFNKTSIADIVKNAGVAKGTFYLYFKDKYDIRNHLIAHKASQVLIFIMDDILDQLANNLNLVRLLSKHLSWGFFKNSLFFTPSEDTPSIHTIYDSMLQNANHTYHSPELMMYMILELVSGTSYNSILYQQPVGLEELKPQLHQAVRGIFNQYRADEITDIPET